MPSQERKVSILLNNGVDNRTLDELTAPAAKQGDSPVLKKSTNTRLGVVPGAVVRSPAFTSITSRAEPTRVRAIVSAAAGRSTLVYSDNDFRGVPTSIIDAGRKAGAPWSFLGSSTDRSSQVGLMPVQVSSSRGLSSARAVSQFAQAYHETTGFLFYAYIANDSTNGTSQLDRVMVGVNALDGSAVAAPQQAATFAIGMSRWVGVTAHGANGVRVWYQNTAGQGCYRTVQYTGGGVLIGAEVVVLQPGNTTYPLDVVRGDDTYALLAHSRIGVAADGSISKININTAAFSSVNFVNALNGGGHVAIQCASPEGTAVVATVFASTAAGTAIAYAHNFATMAAISTSAAMTCSGRVSVGFNHNDALSSGAIGPQLSVMVERTVANAVTVARPDPRVDHYLIDQATGGWIVATSLPWYRLAGRAAQWVVSGQMLHTIHQLVPRRATTLESPGAANYADDPSLDLYWVRAQADNTQPGLLARLGCVRGTSSPVDHLYSDKLSSGSLLCVGNELYAAYRLLPDYSSAASGSARGRLTVVSLGPPSGQFSTAHDRDGCGFLAAALPLQWDGVSVAEFGGPVHTPQLFATIAGGAIGDLLPAGVYSFQAVLFWTDASGLVHRSRPSPLRRLTVTGVEYIELQVSYIPTALPSSVEARIYATETNGETLHLMATQSARDNFQVWTAGAKLVTAANPQIYSGGGNGEEIVPQPPPPAWDVAIVGPRCWIVDAEIRSRAVYSKLRVAGVGYEFSPGLEVIVPSGAGKLMAVREWQGMPLLLAERGVYQVAGEGPNNTLGGPGSFAPPVKVSDLGCSNRASIVQFPGGIMWQSGNRFVVLDGRGLRYVPDFECTHDVSAALCLERYSEVQFFSATTAEVRVYHHESGRWTTFDTQTLPELVQAAHVLPWDADAAILQLGAGPTTFRRLDAASVSSAANEVLETDWLLLGDDFQSDVLLQYLVFNGRLSGSYAGLHNLQLDVFYDYATVAETSRSWTSAELDLIDVNGFYSVKVESVRKTGCRAVKVRVTDTHVAGYGMSPRSLTLVYQVEGAIRDEVFVQGSFK